MGEDFKVPGEGRDYSRLLTDYGMVEYEWTRYKFMYEGMCISMFGPPKHSAPLATKIPDELLSRYAMNGAAEIGSDPQDARKPPNWPLVYIPAWVDFCLAKIAKKEAYAYGITDAWVWTALEEFLRKGQRVGIIGSTSPWYESNVLYYGGIPVTIEYNPIMMLDSRLSYLSPSELKGAENSFDAILSISSIEHDGLGMYGDPLDPEGDLKSMAIHRGLLKEGGLMFLAVPVGKDAVIFNSVRRYGKARLPLLTQGFKQIKSYGLSPLNMEQEGCVHALMVLEKN